MKVWSKGLGKVELIFELEKYWLEKKEDEDGEMTYCVKGTIQEPVVWEFVITMTKEDIPGLMMMALDWKILSMFFNNPKSFIASTAKYALVFLGLKKGVQPDKQIQGPGKKSA
jgi:hypothetical protein